jgi:hypothetical protein
MHSQLMPRACQEQSTPTFPNETAKTPRKKLKIRYNKSENISHSNEW